MNLSDAQRFEYTLNLFKEYLSSKRSKNYPDYQIVWKLDNELVVGHLLRWSSSNRSVLVKLKIDNGLEVYDDILPTDDAHKNSFPRDLRERWFDKYQTNWGIPEQIYLNPVALLTESIKFIQSQNFNEIADIQPVMYNVKYLQSSLKLDFLKLDSDCSLEPVSLIQLSQN